MIQKNFKEVHPLSTMRQSIGYLQRDMTNLATKFGEILKDKMKGMMPVDWK